MITDGTLENWFTYHAPSAEQAERYTQLRAGALKFAKTIRDLTPESADQTAAIRLLRECVFTANAAIACNESGT